MDLISVFNFFASHSEYSLIGYVLLVCTFIYVYHKLFINSPIKMLSTGMLEIKELIHDVNEKLMEYKIITTNATQEEYKIIESILSNDVFFLKREIPKIIDKGRKAKEDVESIINKIELLVGLRREDNKNNLRLYNLKFIKTVEEMERFIMPIVWVKCRKLVHDFIAVEGNGVVGTFIANQVDMLLDVYQSEYMSELRTRISIKA